MEFVWVSSKITVREHFFSTKNRKGLAGKLKKFTKSLDKCHRWNKYNECPHRSIVHSIVQLLVWSARLNGLSERAYIWSHYTQCILIVSWSESFTVLSSHNTAKCALNLQSHAIHRLYHSCTLLQLYNLTWYFSIELFLVESIQFMKQML